MDSQAAIYDRDFRLTCALEAAAQYRLPRALFLAIAFQERGMPDQWVANTDGSFDVGPMQLNTHYLADLARYGIKPADAARTDCYPFQLAAWRLRGHLLHDDGDLWTRAANYHSRTSAINAIYRAQIIQRAEQWRRWLGDGAIPLTPDFRKAPLPALRTAYSRPVATAASTRATAAYVPRKIIVKDP